MGAEDNIYNRLVPTYKPQPLTKYDTHKASELRNIVNEITKLTKESPTYFVKLNDAKQTYLLGMVLGNFVILLLIVLLII